MMNTPTKRRLMWYLFYIPIILIPMVLEEMNFNVKLIHINCLEDACGVRFGAVNNTLEQEQKSSREQMRMK